MEKNGTLFFYVLLHLLSSLVFYKLRRGRRALCIDPKSPTLKSDPSWFDDDVVTTQHERHRVSGEKEEEVEEDRFIRSPLR